MTDDPESITLRHLQAIRDEQAITNKKLGVLADGIVSLRRDVNGLTSDVHALRNDVQTIAIAFDGYNERLTSLEARLDRIESHLDPHGRA